MTDSSCVLRQLRVYLYVGLMWVVHKNKTIKTRQMYLEKLYLSNFRNYSDAKFVFSPHINCILGANGSGKTNVLEAIYLLALTKTVSSAPDVLNICHGQSGFFLEGFFTNDVATEQITCAVFQGQKKVFTHDKVPYERLIEHIGKYPLVLISPEDTDIIREASDMRRKFFDGILSQASHAFLLIYQQYNRILDQRNKLLKQFAERKYTDNDLLMAYNEPLLSLGKQIFEARQSFLSDFLPRFLTHYQSLSEGKERADIAYISCWQSERFENDFLANQSADIQAQRTILGCHKDDFLFTLDGHPVKKFGSQGQKKSFVMALRLAQYELLETYTGRKPLLLLDDIFDKLDDHRIARLLAHINHPHFGQVFITDARPERTLNLTKQLSREVTYLYR